MFVIRIHPNQGIVCFLHTVVVTYVITEKFLYEPKKLIGSFLIIIVNSFPTTFRSVVQSSGLPASSRREISCPSRK